MTGNSGTHSRIRKGFTLVELMIAIVIIVILAAMIMISAGELIATSRASVITSNLRNLKSAVTFWYVDNQDKIVKQSNGAYLVKYNGMESPIQEFWENRKDKSYRDTSTFKGEVLRYMSNVPNIGASGSGYTNSRNGSTAVTSGAYRLEDNGGAEKRDRWFIGYVISDGTVNDQSALRRKLAGKAKSLGLLQNNKKDSPYYTDGDVVWMMILQL